MYSWTAASSAALALVVRCAALAFVVRCAAVAFVVLLGVSCADASAKRSLLKEKRMYLFDATYLYDQKVSNDRYWDEMHFIASLQGIVNREEPRLYIYFVGDGKGHFDRQWLSYLREQDGWLRDVDIVEIGSLDELVRTFRDQLKGVVVYDPAVPATSNVASTIAGVEDLACVRHDPRRGSIYRRMVEDPNGHRLPVVRKLLTDDNKSLFTGSGSIPSSETPSTGSAKCDAYIWAKERYLDTGKCDPTIIGYYIDSFWTTRGGDRTLATLTNQDYAISRRAFFFDLGPWEDEAPNDDLTQPPGTDYHTFNAIMRAAYDQTGGRKMIHFSGFTPWAFKYVDYADKSQKYGGVPTEWKTAEILSTYNAYLDADAIGLSGMANASFYRHYPLKKKYAQKLPAEADLRAKGYIDTGGKVIDKTFVTIYVGDYDSAAWLYQRMYDYWQDPARGAIPLGWAFNPNLADRFPVGMAMTRDHASANDFFVAGDCGAGYLNPSLLVEPRPYSRLPSGLDTWTEHCRRYYEQWDLHITGFIIDGNARAMDDNVKTAYTKFSPRGIVAQKIDQKGVFKGMPFVRMDYDIYTPVDKAAETVLHRIEAVKSKFMIFRTILWTPTNHKELFELIKQSPQGARIEIVDPYTFFLLVKLSEEEKR